MRMRIKNAQQIIQPIDDCCSAQDASIYFGIVQGISAQRTHTHRNQFTMKFRSEKSIDRFVFSAVILIQAKTKKKYFESSIRFPRHSHCNPLSINSNQNNCVSYLRGVYLVDARCIGIFFNSLFFCSARDQYE